MYVADFGLATMKIGTRRTTQMKAGTPGFQSPEQLKGESIGPSSDEYAIGCIMYELFVEKPVWEGLSAHSITFHVAVQGQYLPAHSVPVSSLFSGSKDKDFGNRFTWPNSGMLSK